jgi:hypothetical protein
VKDFVSGNANAGSIIYDAGHQAVTYTQPNWQDDDLFGLSLACGSKTTKQKDTVQLADVDYGQSGKFSIQLWFRHEDVNFENYQREQLIGHGDALQGTSTPQQFHVQLERSNKIRTVNGYYGDTPVDASHFDTNWHHYVFTTDDPDIEMGEFYVYIDGVLKSTVKNTDTRKSYGAFDPKGAFRLCGRLKPASWAGGSADATEWDSRRYFMGKVAHFAVWNSALKASAIKEMYTMYKSHCWITTAGKCKGNCCTTTTTANTETSHAMPQSFPWLLSSFLVASAAVFMSA